MFNHSYSSNGVRAARENKMAIFQFYDTSRSKTRGGDMKIN